MTSPGVDRYIPHVRLTWGGAIGVPEVEIWSNSVNFRDPADLVADESQLQAIVEAVAPDVRTWYTAGSSLIGPAASLKWVKAVWIQRNGRQRDVNTALHDYPSGVFGTANQGVPIWEQTYCLTFRTALNRGRGHAGRIYPPLSGAPPVDKTPYIDPANANNMALSGATLLTALKASFNAQFTGIVTPLPNWQPVVISPGPSGMTGAMAQPITRVVVDRVADIQHRRTNRVPRSEGNASAVG